MVITKPIMPTKIIRAQKGLTLIELMVAISILAVLLLGLGMSILQIDRTNIFNHDRALAYKAAQQILEVIMNEDLTDAISRHNTTFSVAGMTGCSGENIGTISVQDLNWDGMSNQCYLFTITVANPDPQKNVIYARICAVRTGQT